MIQSSVKYRTQKFALQEGLISHLWQCWCAFCRDIVIASTQGAITSSGQTTSSPYATMTLPELAFIAHKLAKRQPIGVVTKLSGSRLEPTWGDTSKLNLIVSGMQSTNMNSLLTAFGIARSVADLQMCRNACAHLNIESVQRIVAARVRYNSTAFSHPSDFMFWIEPSTSDFVWRAWVDEMELISHHAIT